MIVLRKRGTCWYADRQKILNSKGFVNIDEAQISPEITPIFASEADKYCVIEDYNEMVCELRNMYVAELRFYDNFQKDEGIIWINYDSGVKWFELYRLDKDEVFLGKWIYNFENKIYASIKVMSNRYLVVRKSWYDMARRALVKEGYMQKKFL